MTYHPQGAERDGPAPHPMWMTRVATADRLHPSASCGSRDALEPVGLDDWLSGSLRSAGSRPARRGGEMSDQALTTGVEAPPSRPAAGPPAGRELTVRGATVLGIGSMIGAGIFALLG